MLKLSEGKYTIISPEDNKGNFRALRYGEEWRDLTGDGLVLSLVQHAEELEAENERLRGNVGAEAALRRAAERARRRAAETTGTVVIYRDGKIVQEEVSKGKLHGLTVKLARECFDDGYDAGMERAAEIRPVYYPTAPKQYQQGCDDMAKEILSELETKDEA